MLKNRFKKIEDRQPQPARDIEYIAYFAGQEPEPPGELISIKGKNPAIETYRLPDGSLKPVWHYSSGPWGSEEKQQNEQD